MKVDIDAVVRLRALADKLGSQREAAQALEVSEPYLSDILRGRRRVSDAMLAKLGLRRTVIEVGKR